MRVAGVEEPMTIRERIEWIAAQNNGTITPSAIVEDARDADSPLHECFTWDDTEAAEKWRLHQARNLIRVFVTHVPTEKGEVTVRAFHSLRDDRKDGTGYRTMENIRADASLLSALVSEALADLRSWRHRYEALRAVPALSAVFAALDGTLEPESEQPKAEQAQPTA